MSSLGYRRGADLNSARPGEVSAVRSTTVRIESVPETAARRCTVHMIGLKGFLPCLFYATLFGAAPLLYTYVDYDYTSAEARGGVITASFVYAAIAVMANDCACWFNMLLLFHIGIEVRVMDVLMTFAKNAGTSDGHEIIAWTGFAVILVHLIPFLLVDNTMFLAVLAFAGVIVNASALIYLDPSLLLIVGFSSTVLLMAVLCFSGHIGVRTSLLHGMRQAITSGKWITCS